MKTKISFSYFGSSHTFDHKVIDVQSQLLKPIELILFQSWYWKSHIRFYGLQKSNKKSINIDLVMVNNVRSFIFIEDP